MIGLLAVAAVSLGFKRTATPRVSVPSQLGWDIEIAQTAVDSVTLGVGRCCDTRQMMWAQIVITVLTVAAFVLSAVGLLGARRHAKAGVARMEDERVLRSRERARQDAACEQATREPDKARVAELRRAADSEYVAAHTTVGLEPWTLTSMDVGREFLAERIIRELDTSTRGDVVLVGIGLLCGLAAGIWDVWL